MLVPKNLTAPEPNVRRLELIEAMDNLEKEIGGIRDRLSSLRIQLEPVLRPLPELARTNGEEMRPPVCPVTARIQNYTSSLIGLGGEIENIQNLLAI